MSKAFYPQGPTILIALTSAASAGVCPSSGAGLQGMKIDNLSTNNVFATFGGSSTAAAALPTTAAGQNGVMIPYLKSITVRTQPNPFVSALTTGATLTAICALTLGAGID